MPRHVPIPRGWRVGAALLLGLWFSTLPFDGRAADVTVFAAASLKNALDDVIGEFEAREEASVSVSYAGSSSLARQIEAGAPADVFISANVAWMDRLEERGLIVPDSRTDLLGNRLVLVAHGRHAPVELGAGTDLSALLGEGRLAMALLGAVPAGIYGKAALSSLGLWQDVAQKVVEAENVRAALALVARGEAPYGIVYATDAAAEDDAHVVATFAQDTHPPIVYPAALVAGYGGALAERFLTFVRSDVAAALFARHGFSVLE